MTVHTPNATVYRASHNSWRSIGSVVATLYCTGDLRTIAGYSQPEKSMNSALRQIAILILVAMPIFAHASPQRIVSIGLCTDQLLLLLADREQIASLSNWALDERMSYMRDAVGDIPINHASIEEIILLEPDLVIASEFVGRDTMQYLQRLGYPVAQLPVPTSVAETYDLIRQMGRHIGNSGRAESMVDSMRQQLMEIRSRYANRPPKTLVTYGPNGYTIGANTLENDIFLQAGYRNLAAEMGIEGFQSISLERLIAADPDVLQVDRDLSRQNALATSRLTHPVITKIMRHREPLDIPLRLRICAGPMLIEAVEMMAARR